MPARLLLLAASACPRSSWAARTSTLFLIFVVGTLASASLVFGFFFPFAVPAAAASAGLLIFVLVIALFSALAAALTGRALPAAVSLLLLLPLPGAGLPLARLCAGWGLDGLRVILGR